MTELEALRSEIDELRFDLQVTLRETREKSRRIHRIEETLNALLAELPYNPAHATAEARLALSREL